MVSPQVQNNVGGVVPHLPIILLTNLRKKIFVWKGKDHFVHVLKKGCSFRIQNLKEPPAECDVSTFLYCCAKDIMILRKYNLPSLCAQ